ncbi:hypothetical protein MVEG_06312 [Podila verticillata NRRL 6337]|nr:hypothetical protein MVEG_06312 [Podila verticillata NRRL 6337]
MTIPKFTFNPKHAPQEHSPPILADNTSHTSPSTQPSPLQIPEILESIFSYLDRTTILNSVRQVCRQWYLISRRFASQQLAFNDYDSTKSYTEVFEIIPHAGNFRWICNNTKDQSAWAAFRAVLEKMNQHFLMNGSSTAPTDISSPVPLREFHILGSFSPGWLMLTLPLLPCLTYLKIDYFIAARFSMDLILHTCPELATLHIQGMPYLVALTCHTNPLSSIDLSPKSDSLLERIPGDRSLKLKSLTIKQCQLDQSSLVDVLAVSPQLQELILIANTVLGAQLPARRVSRGVVLEELIPFIGKACPRLHKIHFSLYHKPLGPANVQLLIQSNPHVTDWSFLKQDAYPSLAQQLIVARNVVTYLEIALYDNSGTDIFVPRASPATQTSSGWVELVRQGLHGFLCAAPLLLHLKTDAVNCCVEGIDPFPEALQVMMFKPQQSTAPPLVTEYTTPPKLWACRNLESLTLHFIRGRRVLLDSDGRYTRFVFGYLSRVCPKLKRLHLGLQDSRLDFQSGMCLLSRLDYLEGVSFGLPGQYSRWPKSLDMSWLTQSSSTVWTKLVRAREVAKWSQILKEENELIYLRKEYLQQIRDQSRVLEELDSRIVGGTEFAYPLSHLGTALDVRMCLKEIESKGAQCLPRLEWIRAQTSMRERDLFAKHVSRARPSLAGTK